MPFSLPVREVPTGTVITVDGTAMVVQGDYVVVNDNTMFMTPECHAKMQRQKTGIGYTRIENVAANQ